MTTTTRTTSAISTGETPEATPRSDRPRTTTRPLEAGETGTLRRVFGQLSRRSAYLRYHGAVPRLTPAMERQLTALVPGVHEALVAEHDGEPVGIARWILDPNEPGVVEVAVEVADAMHRRGIGDHLLRRIMAAARRAGAHTMVAHVHSENDAVIRWLRRYGAERPGDPYAPFRLSLTSLPLGDNEVDTGHTPCGCMSGCRCGCSDRSGSDARETCVNPGEPDRATSSPSSSPGVVVPFPRRSSWTSSGETRRRA